MLLQTKEIHSAIISFYINQIYDNINICSELVVSL